MSETQAPPATPAPEQQQPAAEQPPPTPAAASAQRDRGPKREPSGAEKRRRAKAKAAAGDAPASPSSGRSASALLARELKDIEAALHALLSVPAAPMMMAGDEWAAQHVEARAQPLAHQIVELARRNPVFRAQLLKLMNVSESGQLAFAAAAYLVPLLIYYGLVPVPPPVREQLKVPDRAMVREMAFAGAHGEAVRSPDAPTPPGARFTEQPPGTPGTPPAPAPAEAGPTTRAG